jgi:DnaJ-domain-containing protein 1
MPLRVGQRLTLAAALVLAVGTGPVQAWGQGAGPRGLFHAVGPLPGADGVDALAINADESILAKAVARDGAVRVELYDRPSRTLLGSLNATVGDRPVLRFAPDQDLLLVAGSKAMQLWEVPIAPLKPDQALAESHRRWEQPMAGEPPADVRFNAPATVIYWTQGGGLFRRGIDRSSAPAAAPVWPPAESQAAVESFALAHRGGAVAVRYTAEKDLDILDAQATTRAGRLSGHRFPVTAVSAQLGRGWLSLDQGNNLIRWSESRQQQALTHLAGLPKQFQAMELAPLGARHILLLGNTGGAAVALVLNPSGWKVEDELSAPAVRQVAISPTGRYVLLGDGKTARLLSFAHPEPPLDYVRRLRDLNATAAAQGFVRMLDEAVVTPRIKANLTAELNRTSPAAELREALERLAQARKEGNRDNIRYWAEQVLNLQPRQTEALEAMQAVKLAADRAVLDQARQALEAGNPSQALSLLSTQLGQDSPLRDEAATLVKQAEARRAQNITLAQARDQMNLGDMPAAGALVEQVLRQDPEHPAALALRDEIQARGVGGNVRQGWAALLGGGLAALIMALLWRYVRARRSAPAALAEPRSGAMPPGPRPRPQSPPGGARRPRRTPPRPEPMTPRRERLEAPGAERRSPARLQVVEAALEKAEERLRLTRLADVSREHTALFMALEAELAALRRRVSDPAADLGPLHIRLKAIAEELRSLKFSDTPSAPPEDAPPGNDVATPTWYDVLQVDPGAAESEIKAAYHRLLKQYHPDLHTRSDFGWVKAEAERMSRMIGQAYEVLGNAERRQAYDQQLARERPGFAAARRQQGARE